MKLLTKGILKKLPAIRATEHSKPEDIKVPLKLFNPCGSESWFITEYDPETKEGFGYVTGHGHDELGYISIASLEIIRLPYGLKIERDRHWDPNTTLREVMNKTKR